MTLNDSSEAGTVPEAGEEIHDEVEIEVYGKQNVRSPKAKKYVIRIDKTKYTVHVHEMTGRQLLELAGKVPPERFTISMKLHGGHAEPIGLDQEVEFSAHCVERFMTLPLDQTEG